MLPQSCPIKTDRLLGVDLLAKFEFCARAGLLSAEIPSEDTGEEEDMPQRLDYLPDYDEVIIRHRPTSLMRNFWLISGSLLIELSGVGYFAKDRMELSVLCGVVMGVSLFWWFGVFRAITILRRRLDAAEHFLGSGRGKGIKRNVSPDRRRALQQFLGGRRQRKTLCPGRLFKGAPNRETRHVGVEYPRDDAPAHHRSDPPLIRRLGVEPLENVHVWIRFPVVAVDAGVRHAGLG